MLSTLSQHIIIYVRQASRRSHFRIGLFLCRVEVWSSTDRRESVCVFFYNAIWLVAYRTLTSYYMCICVQSLQHVVSSHICLCGFWILKSNVYFRPSYVAISVCAAAPLLLWSEIKRQPFFGYIELCRRAVWCLEFDRHNVVLSHTADLKIRAIDFEKALISDSLMVYILVKINFPGIYICFWWIKFFIIITHRTQFGTCLFSFVLFVLFTNHCTCKIIIHTLTTCITLFNNFTFNQPWNWVYISYKRGRPRDPDLRSAMITTWLEYCSFFIQLQHANAKIFCARVVLRESTGTMIMVRPRRVSRTRKMTRGRKGEIDSSQCGARFKKLERVRYCLGEDFLLTHFFIFLYI